MTPETVVLYNDQRSRGIISACKVRIEIRHHKISIVVDIGGRSIVEIIITKKRLSTAETQNACNLIIIVIQRIKDRL